MCLFVVKTILLCPFLCKLLLSSSRILLRFWLACRGIVHFLAKRRTSLFQKIVRWYRKTALFTTTEGGYIVLGLLLKNFRVLLLSSVPNPISILLKSALPLTFDKFAIVSCEPCHVQLPVHSSLLTLASVQLRLCSSCFVLHWIGVVNDYFIIYKYNNIWKSA